MKIPKQVSLKHFSIILIITVLLTSFAFYVWGASPSNTFYISSGIYPRGSFTVFNEGINYFAKNSNGGLAYSGTNATYIIQTCIDNLPSYNRKLVLVGQFVLDGHLFLDSNMELDLTDAYVKQGRTGATYSSIIWASGKHNIYIHGGRLDGNKAGGTTNHGIAIQGLTTAPFTYAYNCTVENVHLFNVNGTGIVLLNASNCIVKNNYICNVGNPVLALGPAIRIDSFSNCNVIEGNVIENIVEHGIRLYENCERNVISNNIIIQANATGISASSDYNIISNNQLKDCNDGHVIYVSGSYNIIDGNCIVDCYGNALYGIRVFHDSTVSNNQIHGSYYGILNQNNCSITGNIVTVEYYCLLSAGNYTTISNNVFYNSNTGIRIEGGYANMIIGNTCTDNGYGIREITGDYNVIVGCNTRLCGGVNGILLSGANSHCHLSWNVTTWIS